MNKTTFFPRIKKNLSIKLYNVSVYDQKYIKAKVKEFNDIVNTNILK